MESKEKEVWEAAKKRVGFRRHLYTYIVINAFLWAVWFFSEHLQTQGEPGGVPWPVYPMIGWGIALAFQFRNAYLHSGETAIRREVEKLKKSGKF